MDRDYVDRHHPAHALLMRVDERVGLTGEDFRTLARWAS